MLLAQPDWRADVSLHMNWMLRVVRVDKALEARGYGTGIGAELHLEVVAHRIRDEFDKALECLEGGLALTVEKKLVQFELQSRLLLAMTFGQMGRFAESDPHLDRCGEIMDDGQDWAGRQGELAMARAVNGVISGMRRPLLE